MCSTFKKDFERIINQLSSEEVTTNDGLKEVISEIKEELSSFWQLPALKERFHLLCHKISIGEIITNKRLIKLLENLETRFRTAEAY